MASVDFKGKDSLMIGSQSIGKMVEMVNNTNPSMSLDDSYDNHDYQK
jgi:hypothetical protein